MSIQSETPPPIPPKSPRRVSRMHTVPASSLHVSGSRTISLLSQVPPIPISNHGNGNDFSPPPPPGDIITWTEGSSRDDTAVMSTISSLPTLPPPPRPAPPLPSLSINDFTLSISTTSGTATTDAERSMTPHSLSKCSLRVHSSITSINSLSDSPGRESETEQEVFNLHSHPIGSPISQHIHKVDPPMLYVEGSVSTNTSKMGDWNSGHQTSQEANAAVHISYGAARLDTSQDLKASRLPPNFNAVTSVTLSGSSAGGVTYPSEEIYSAAEVDPESSNGNFKSSAVISRLDGSQLLTRDEQHRPSSHVHELADFFTTEPAPVNTESNPESNYGNFKSPTPSPGRNSPRLLARNERQCLSSNVRELVDFFATVPAPVSSDDQEQPAAFAALADGKKYINLKDVASRGLGWRHWDQVLDSDLDRWTEVTATPRFRKPMPQKSLDDESQGPSESDVHWGLWSNLKSAFCFGSGGPILHCCQRTHRHHAIAKIESSTDARTSKSDSRSAVI